jgi:hypothetical protein
MEFQSDTSDFDGGAIEFQSDTSGFDGGRRRDPELQVNASLDVLVLPRTVPLYAVSFTSETTSFFNDCAA